MGHEAKTARPRPATRDRNRGLAHRLAVAGEAGAQAVLNRFSNLVIRNLFRHDHNDTTNEFKTYRREVIETVQPLLSNHFNLTAELPLKAIVHGHSYAVCPISWTNRREGVSKLSLQKMGSRYLFIVLYVWLEHHLSRGDYRIPGAGRGPQHLVNASQEKGREERVGSRRG